MPYSRFMHKLKSEGIAINRKMLAHLAVVDPKVWSLLAQPISY
jgi:ribosomal protein L20